jgi:hypothetical protein
MPVDCAPIAARRRKPSNLGQPVADSNQMHLPGPAAMRANAGDFLERHIDQAARSQPVLLELDLFRHGNSLSHNTGALVAAGFRWDQFEVDAGYTQSEVKREARIGG